MHQPPCAVRRSVTSSRRRPAARDRPEVAISYDMSAPFFVQRDAERLRGLGEGRPRAAAHGDAFALAPVGGGVLGLAGDDDAGAVRRPAVTT